VFFAWLDRRRSAIVTRKLKSGATIRPIEGRLNSNRR
jgi:hypothetical protein